MGCGHSSRNGKADDLLSHMVRERKKGARVDDYYEGIRSLGHGSMGTVSQIRSLQTGHLYALKTIQLARISSRMVQEMRNEIAVLRRLDHPNIIRAVETFESKRRVYLVMELCTGGDLTRRGPYKESQVAALTTKILSAVAYMHEVGICHRDLKLENILFENSDPGAEIQLIDFGLSKIYLKNNRMHEVVGTLYSMAPEVIKGTYDQSCDMWSVGIIVYVLLSGAMPFNCSSRQKLVAAIECGEYSFPGRRWQKVSHEAQSFIRHLIVKDPTGRYTAREALQSPWLRRHEDGVASERSEASSPSVHGPETLSILQSMRKYCSYGKLKKAALMVIAHRSEPDKIKNLREAFQSYDSAHTGTITVAEFRAALKASSFEEQEELAHLFEEMDEDHDGQLHYTEFLAATLEAAGQLEEERLADAFDRMDGDDTGFISRANLIELLGKDSEKYNVEELIAQADFKKDGQIGLGEFLKLMRSEPALSLEVEKGGEAENGLGLASSTEPLPESKEDTTSPATIISTAPASSRAN